MGDRGGLLGLGILPLLQRPTLLSQNQPLPPRRFTPPSTVQGVPVTAGDEVAVFRGEEWVTLGPEAEDDERIWEFSLSTGKIIQTR